MLERGELRIKVPPQFAKSRKQRKVYVLAITRIVMAQNKFFQKEGGSYAESYVLGTSNNWFLHWDPEKREFVLSHRYGINRLEKLCVYVAILDGLGLIYHNPDYFKEVRERILAILNPKPESPKTMPQS